MVKKYNYFYKITNLINGHFYYGIHSTDNIDDGYMGSGHRLHRAFNKYGSNNFIKEILKYFDTREEALDYEEYIVNETLVKDNNCYNEILGGSDFNPIGKFPVYNKETNEKILVEKTDERYLSGKYVTMSYGKTPVIDKYNNHYLVDKDDERLKTGELKKQFEGRVCVRDKEGNKFYVDKNDTRYLSGELVAYNKGMFLAKDKDGNKCMIYKDDPRYLSGELVANSKGVKKSKDHINKIILAKNKKLERKASQEGTCWIYNEIENKKIKIEELEEYINNGWIKGRKVKFK